MACIVVRDTVGFLEVYFNLRIALVWLGCAAAEAERCGQRVELGGALHRPGAPPSVHHPSQGHRHRQGDLCQSRPNQGCLAQIHCGEPPGTVPYEYCIATGTDFNRGKMYNSVQSYYRMLLLFNN
jgi:hypothetical protein